MMRQLVGAGVELGVSQAVAPRTPPRSHRGFALPAHQTVPARSRTGSDGRCRSTRAEWCGAPRRRECRGCQSAARELATAASSSRMSRSRHRLARSPDRTDRWRIRARRRCPAACRPRRAARPELSDRSNLALAVVDRFEAVIESRQLEARRRVVLEHQHHLEQRVPRQRARRVEHLHQAARTAGPDARRPPDWLTAPAPISSRKLGLPDVSVRSTRVLTKKPTRSSSAAVGAAGDRAADRDVGARPKPGEQRRKAGLQHHEQARLAVAGERQQSGGAARRSMCSGTRPPR